MPAILAFLGAFATRSFIWAILAQVLVGLGVSVVSYVGLNLLLDQITAQIQGNMNTLTADALAIIKIARLDDAISVQISALVARMTLSGLTEAGKLSRITWARQGPIVLN